MVVASPNPSRAEKPEAIELPVINLSAERTEVAKLITKACEEYGFFMVINHGVSEETIAAMEEEGLNFFTRPDVEKQRAGPAVPYGYGRKNIGFNGDIGEVEYLLLHTNPLSISQSSITISGDPQKFCPQILTILRSNDVGGLQIRVADAVWVPVPPDPTAFCVNVGDVLQAMTNGRFMSVRHRALTNINKPRMSMAYFGAPPLHARVTAPPELVTPHSPLLYRPFTWGEYKKASYSLQLGDSRLQLFRK
ncbi:Gibberellin 2-beta-dioxygenase 2 [Hibiscus syriacus]|uniref:Gibberellin 2-beta-dioxygenase 2 n=1 Tax=Hibiscus syriacus TaxID=106335 RepID=A0A6A3AJG7_HIBSY|nr:gibberellin 2-beta-dioxygenase 2-like [Hibiscus syriacus]KAE8703395.1 Gibberellin 2-beta-dioxygenase 2 [Hibiscus syriacus]